MSRKRNPPLTRRFVGHPHEAIQPGMAFIRRMDADLALFLHTTSLLMFPRMERTYKTHPEESEPSITCFEEQEHDPPCTQGGCLSDTGGRQIMLKSILGLGTVLPLLYRPFVDEVLQ